MAVALFSSTALAGEVDRREATRRRGCAMILVIQNVLTPENVTQIRSKLETMNWVDGTATAGWHAKLVKKNLQVDRNQLDYPPLNKAVTETLMRNPTFRMAARPRQFTPLLFSRYRDDMEYGTHVDDP